MLDRRSAADGDPLAPSRVAAILALPIKAWSPAIPNELRQLIRRMASDNSLWGDERIANELLVKLGIRVSPRTVRK